MYPSTHPYRCIYGLSSLHLARPAMDKKNIASALSLTNSPSVLCFLRTSACTVVLCSCGRDALRRACESTSVTTRGGGGFCKRTHPCCPPPCHQARCRQSLHSPNFGSDLRCKRQKDTVKKREIFQRGKSITLHHRSSFSFWKSRNARPKNITLHHSSSFSFWKSGNARPA